MNGTTGKISLMRITIVFLVTAIFISPVFAQQQVGYNFDVPSNEAVLPSKLKEVSGLSMGADGDMYVVEDENGFVYLIDPQNGQIQSRKKFASSGDYEGIELISGLVFVLRSSGHLFFTDFSSTKKKAKDNIRLDLPSSCNAEALGYNRAQEQILVGCKSGDGVPKRQGRSIFAFDLSGNRLSDEPYFFIDAAVLRNACGECHLSARHFQPSGLAVHPVTQDLYILSAVGERLLIHSTTGDTIVNLDIDDMPQPEGIAFDGENRLYISSEGTSKRARLFRFDPISEN